jgi:methylase of polypeptide subunit release factors
VPPIPSSATPCTNDCAALAQLRELIQQAGFTEDAVATVLPSSTGFITPNSPHYAAAMDRTRAETTFNTLVRLFVIGASIPLETARRALSPVTPEALVQMGLATAGDGDTLAPLLTLIPIEGTVVAFDSPASIETGARPDLVNAVTLATLALAHASVPGPAGQTLDLGTGSGILALLAARWSREVYALDINPRAVAFAEFSAQLNGAANVHCRAGDLFAPVAGMTFDRILCNPPFAVTPSKRYVYRDSGMEGDSFARLVAGQAPAYLAEGGYFQMLFDWIHPAGVDWQARLSAWFEGSGCDVLVWRTETLDPLPYADKWIATTEQSDAEVVCALYDEWMAYYRAAGIEAISTGYVTIRRRTATPAAPNWVAIDDAPPLRTGFYGSSIRLLFEARDLLDQGPEHLREVRLQAISGLRLIERGTLRPGRWEMSPPQVCVAEGLRSSATIDANTAALIGYCDGARTVAEVAGALAARMGAAPADVEPACLGIIGSLLGSGFLVPAPAREGVRQ